jgi:uncharacterized protein (DUF2164 family)
MESLKLKMSSEIRDDFVHKTQKYLNGEFDIDIGQFEAEEFFNILCDILGPVFYNQGIEDSKDYLMGRFIESTEDLVQIEIK